jgi:hypothetical protein
VRRRHRKDDNHKEVQGAIEQMGYLFLNCSQSALGFDALAVKAGRFVPIEIKDGKKRPSARKLTPHEVKVHAALKAHGVTVEIVTGINDSLDVLRLRDRNYYGKEERR